jgi:hypothetical protein
MSLADSPFDLRNDLAVQAAKSLDAKIDIAIRAAFDAGKDFVRSADLTYDPGNFMEPRPLHEPHVHTISYRGGALDPADATPAGFIRYSRPKDWRTGSSLIGRFAR